MRNINTKETFMIAGGEADGCTGVPNAPLGYDFTQACNNHDNNYDRGMDKSTADNIFLNDMLSACKEQSSNAFSNLVCNGLAYTYYAGVSLFGGFFYPGESSSMFDASSNGGGGFGGGSFLASGH